jgi:MFS family permease
MRECGHPSVPAGLRRSAGATRVRRPAASTQGFVPMLQRVFYGWYVVGAVLVITTAISGFFFYNLSVLLAAFVAERGFPVGIASGAAAAFFLAAGVGGVLAGRLVDRIDVRLVLSGGAIVGTLALASVGALREVWQLYVFHVVLGLAHGFSGLVPVTTVIARWFNVHRSLAFSIGSTGLSLGGMVVAPVVALAVTRYGLDAAAPWMALALFVGVVPMTLLVIRPSPQAMGLTPDGLSRKEAAAAPPQPSVSFRDAMRSRYFQAVSAAYLFLFAAQLAGIAHIYRLALTRDSAETAALALATMAGASTVGRLIGGAVLLRVTSHAFATAMMAAQAAALALLAGAYGSVAVVAGAGLLGLSMGNSLMLHPLLLVERFGTRDYGQIYSMSQLLTVGGAAAGPALAGLIFEASGGYGVPYGAMALTTLIGLAVLVAFTSPPAPGDARSRPAGQAGA